MLSTRPVTEIPPFNNVQNEIFDMIKPANSIHITLKDLINWFVHSFSNRMSYVFFFLRSSGQGGLVLSILIDVSSFWAYEVNSSMILSILQSLIFVLES